MTMPYPFPPAEVFATIASYEDPETPITCASLLADPGLDVRLHVVLQTDDDALEHATRATGAEVLRLPRSSGRGACWPRAVGHTYYGGERYLAMFDSHMRFEPGWALTFADQLQGLGERAALTAYVHDSNSNAPDVPDHSSVMDVFEWGDDGWHCRPKHVHRDGFPGGRPLPARAFSAHCFFVHAALWLTEVPYDPQLYFGGEEQTILLRGWTRGWDFFHPAINVVSHRYHRDGFKFREMIHEHNPEWWKFDVVSKDRIARFYGWERPSESHWPEHGIRLPANPDLGVFGPGDVRSIAEFEEWSGLDIQARTFLTDEEWRRKLAGEDLKPEPAPEPGKRFAGTDVGTPGERAELVGRFQRGLGASGTAETMPCPPELWTPEIRKFLEMTRGQISIASARNHKLVDPILVRWNPAPEGHTEAVAVPHDFLTVLALTDGLGAIAFPDGQAFTILAGDALTWSKADAAHIGRTSDPAVVFVCGWKPG